jgi:Protein of unknown function (DUF4236)
MGWRFRKSFKLIPGVRLNLSKSGLSCSVGGAPFTLNVGQRGIYGTASVPGTGISFRQHFGSGTGNPDEPNSVLPPHSVTPPSFPVPSATVQMVQSASTELLTSESLKELKRVLQTAHEEHDDISSQLATAQNEEQRANRRYTSWGNGFLFKKVF